MEFNQSKPTLWDEMCERETLATAITYNKYLDSLSEEWFYKQIHVTILQAAKAIMDEGKVVYSQSLEAYCNDHKLNIDASQLASLMTNSPCLTAAFAQNVARLKELAQRRKLRLLSQHLDNNATNKAVSVADAIEQAEAGIKEISKAQGMGRDGHYIIDLSKQYPEPKFTLVFDGVGTLAQGDIQAVKAKSKNGKSFVCSILMASMLGCKDFGFTAAGNENKVLYFDTEQNERNTAKLVKRVHKLLGWPETQSNEAMKAYSLRTQPLKDRWPYIRRTVEKEKPTAVFVDGIADLIENFNDQSESNKIIDSLMKLSADNDCAVVCVLHTNKGKDDNAMKGHLGTILLQKASDVFEVVKNDRTFNVTETDCRNQPIDDFSFTLDEHGTPMKSITAKEQKAEANYEALSSLVRKAFGQSREQRYSDLVRLIALHGGASDSTAKRKIREALEFGIIGVNDTGTYSVS